MSPISASRENGLPPDKIEAYLSSSTSLLELFRTLVSQSGMNPLSIIESFNIFMYFPFLSKNDHPFTAPAVSPSTILLWKRTTKVTKGKVVKTVAAEIWSQGISYCEAPESMAIPTGTVREVSRVMKVKARRNSFQQKMKTRMAVVAKAGAERGRIMRTRIPKRLKPSTFAASSKA